MIPHLFRTEWRKLTAVLCKTFGIEHVQFAEDIASETFVSALETWPYKGVPENPVAWLYSVAKNKTINHIQRSHVFTNKIEPHVKNGLHQNEELLFDLSEQNITDSQLQMLFAICHPSLSQEAQIGLALRILCGFGIEEIAHAFLTNKETISKRLFRAKEKLRTENVRIEVPPKTEIEKRLETVLTTIYLVFSEGYYSETNDAVLREDLCLEAMRLAHLLIENEQTNKPEVAALLSLMCFHASRFAARRTVSGEMILYNGQDHTLWNNELISKGAFFLHQSAKGNRISRYHIEAGIAYWHTIRNDTSEKWEAILQLYNQLLMIHYSPIAALNRTFALSKVKGKEEAIREAEKLNLKDNHYYFTLLGELYTGIDNNKARRNFEAALMVAKTKTDRLTIQAKIDRL